MLELCADIKNIYHLMQYLLNTIENDTNKIYGSRGLKWNQKINKSGFKNYNVVLNSITVNYQSILNYFDNRSTNASAASFNAKIKGFRSQFRGVRKIDFFWIILSNLFG
jgi:transposase